MIEVLITGFLAGAVLVGLAVLGALALDYLESGRWWD